jgi:pimeloyl-ACP methyl ester carboxylesterase
LRDHVASPAATRAYDAAPRARRVELDGAGHLPQVFSPELLHAPLRAFLAEIDAR